MIARRAPLVLLALLALPSACRKPSIESYRVPKEPVSSTPAAGTEAAPSALPSSAAPGGNAMASTAVPTAGGAGLTWTAPAGWKAKPASAMRKGSFTVTSDGLAGEADLSITAFPGDVGGDLANLNRWRGQLKLPPIAPADLAAATQRIDRNDLHMIVVDLVGTDATPQRILGAIIPHNGSTWFVKLMGPDALVAKAKPAFTAFLDTITPASAAP